MNNITIIPWSTIESDSVTRHKLIYGDNVAYIIFTIYYDNPLTTRNGTYFRNIHCSVDYVFTGEKYRNNGYATLLLTCLKQYCQNINVNFITLDDCSDNFNQTKNIYRNVGFKYLENGRHEMMLKFRK